MSCCQRQVIDDRFDQDFVAKKIQQYRRSGLKKETRLLVEALKFEGVEGLTLLDVGGGLGAIAHELIRVGVSQTVSVEASQAFLDAAKTEAARQGLADKMTFWHGDLVELASQIPAADIVTLDKVVCCYRDMESLVRASVEKARKLYGLVYPRNDWWMKAAIGFENLVENLKGSDWRVYVHPTQEVERLIREHGLRQRFRRALVDWQIVVYGD
jgi:magnesium-protoporphyrin O-methyltransferase